MQPFVVNGHDRIVLPSNFVPELDLSVMKSLAQLDAVIRRDFEVKAPSGRHASVPSSLPRTAWRTWTIRSSGRSQTWP